MASPLFLRLLIFVTCAMALFGLTPVVMNQWQGLNACPALGPLPACYLVFVGYLAVALSVMSKPAYRNWLFYSGWAPVFLLAFSGTAFELSGRVTCPRNTADVPMCFYSLTIATGLLVAYLLARRRLPIAADA